MRTLRFSAVTGVFFIFYLIQFCFVKPSLGENQTGDSCAVNDGKTCGDCIKVDGCAFCEANKKCLTFSLVKDTYKGTCEKQQWKYKQCLCKYFLMKMLNDTYSQCYKRFTLVWYLIRVGIVSLAENNSCILQV